jgi:hypothetical protein
MNSLPEAAKRVSGLRANALAAVVMLLIQYSLGISVNLYSTLPASDSGKSLFPSFAAAVGKGPALLTLHAVLGTLLLVTAIAAVIRALRLAALAPIALTLAGLAAMLVAWLSGSAFIGDQKNASSLAMALATAVALLCYAIVIFVLKPSAASVAGAQTESR